jgi:uncharacterized protein
MGFLAGARQFTMTRMLLLLIPFLAVYGGVHWYLVRRCQLGGITGYRLLVPLVVWCVLMTVGPIVVVNMDALPSVAVKAAIALVVYLWMAFLFLFLVWSHLLRFGRWSIEQVGRRFRGPSWRLLSPRGELILHLGVTCGLLVYGGYEGTCLKTERLAIPAPQLPPGTQFRLAILADLHLGVLDNTARVERVLTALEATHPDLVIGLGDLTDVQMHDLDPIAAQFRQLQPPAGKLAVLGNHEWYAGLRKSVDFLHDAGFAVLRDTASSVIPHLTMVGFDDPSVRAEATGDGTREASLLRSIDPHDLIIVLRHRPVIASGTIDLFDLQLSAHTHGGQLWPYLYVTFLEYGFWPGLTAIGQRSNLYVGRGAATFGPPVRVFAPPEITVVDLIGPTR